MDETTETDEDCEISSELVEEDRTIGGGTTTGTPVIEPTADDDDDDDDDERGAETDTEPHEVIGYADINERLGTEMRETV